MGSSLSFIFMIYLFSFSLYLVKAVTSASIQHLNACWISVAFFSKLLPLAVKCQLFPELKKKAKKKALLNLTATHFGSCLHKTVWKGLRVARQLWTFLIPAPCRAACCLKAEATYMKYHQHWSNELFFFLQDGKKI